MFPVMENLRGTNFVLFFEWHSICTPLFCIIYSLALPWLRQLAQPGFCVSAPLEALISLLEIGK